MHKAVGQIDFHTFALFAVSPLLRSPSFALSPSPALPVAQLMIDSYLAFYQCAGARSLSHTVQRVISLSLSRSLGAHEIFAYNSRGRRRSRLIVIRRAERKQHTFRDSRGIKENTICTSKNVKYLTQLNCD